MRTTNQLFRICFTSLFILMFAENNTVNAQVCSNITQVEISVLEFVYNSTTQDYEVITPIVLEPEASCVVKIALSKNADPQLIPSEEDLQALRIDYHEWNYSLDPSGQLILQLKSSGGGTPWSTLSTRVVTLLVE